MGTVRKTTAVLTAVIAALAAVHPAGAQEPEPEPPHLTVAVSPADGLIDGQTVTATGTSTGTEWVQVAQCAADVATSSACDSDYGSFTEPAADGSFSIELAVKMVIRTEAGQDVDCRQGDGCVVVAVGEGSDLGDAATAPLVFAPGAEPRPAPTLHVDPSADLVDGQQLAITGTGFIPGYLALFQCAPGADMVCRFLDDVEAAADGTLATSAVVSARLVSWSGEPVDCRSALPRCELVVTPAAVQSSRAGRVELAFDPDGPLPPPPAITVGPAAEIVDPAPLTVTGTDFTRDGSVSVALCRDDGRDSWACEAETTIYTTADSTGAFTATIDATSTFGYGDLTNELVDCRQPPGCAVVARDDTTGLSVSVPVTFGPLAPGRGRYLDPVFPAVDIAHDVVYRQTTRHDGEPVDLRMDIFQPAGDTATERPVVMGMHGGFFIFGDENQLAASSFEYARRGYVAVSISYRLRPDMSTADVAGQVAASYDAYDDALAAVQWLRDHADDYRIDPDAIAAGGYSAGGALAFHFAYTPGQYGTDTPAVAAALPMAGANLGVPEAGEPPVLAQHGVDDPLLPIGNPRDACAQATQVGNVCELVEYPGEGHIISQRRDLLARSVDFLAEHMLAPRGYFEAPTADAGPDVTVAEGASVTLGGSNAPDAGGDPLTHAWLPADRLDDPASPTPTYTGVDDGEQVLAVTVTDAHGTSATDEVTVTTANAPPAIAGVTPMTSAGSSDLSLAVDVTDPGTADTHNVGVDWGDGTVDAAAPDPAHTYAEPGRYQVAVTVTDDDGGTATWTQPVVVGCTRVGTDGDDLLIGLWRDDVICGLGGNDLVIDLSGDDQIYGGPGNDRIHGGRGDDLLDGGEGRDRAWGGAGRDTCTAETTHSCSPDRPRGRR